MSPFSKDRFFLTKQQKKPWKPHCDNIIFMQNRPFHSSLEEITKGVQMRTCVKIIVFDIRADDHKPQVHNPANYANNKNDHFHTENLHVCNLTESSLQTHEGFLDLLHRLPVDINRENSDTYFSFSQWHFQTFSPTLFFPPP